MALLAGFCLGQATSTVSLSNGVQLKVSADFGQPKPPASVSVEMARATGDSFYRIFRDQNGLAIFAYELAVRLSANGAGLTVTAKPAEAEFAAKFPHVDGGKPTPTLSGDHSVGPLKTSQSGQIGLFELEGQGIRAVDTVEVALDSEEHPGRLHLQNLQLKINGEHLVARGLTGAVAGRYAMIYIPGRGGFILASEPVNGRNFIKAGSIDGAKLQFTINNDSYEAEASEPILGEAPSGELWVYFDPSYRPSGNWTKPRDEAGKGAPAAEEFFAGASDSLSWWLPAQ